MSGRGTGEGRGRGGGDRGRGRSSGDGGRGGGGSGFSGLPRGGGRGGGGGGGRGGGLPEVYTPRQGVIPVPNKSIATVEDAVQKSLKSDSSAGLANLSLAATMPIRPGYGTKGTPVVLYTNYFELVPKPGLVLYRYAISIRPEVKGRRLAEQIVRLLLQHEDYVNDRCYITSDFRSMLISCKRLEPARRESIVLYRAEGEDKPAPGAKSYKILVEDTGNFTVSELIEHLTSTNAASAYSQKEPMLQALNVFLGHHSKASPNIATPTSGKSFAIQGERFDLSGGLVALRGFFSSVRVAASRILINVNISHAAFFDTIPLNQMITIWGKDNGRNLPKLASFLKGVRVRTTHLKEKRNKSGQVIHRMKTVNGLAMSMDGQRLDHPPRVMSLGAPPSKVEFWLDDNTPAPSKSAVPGAEPASSASKKGKGKKGAAVTQQSSSGPIGGGRYISVEDFFRQTHGLKLQSPQQPVINVGTRDQPSYLPSEVCIIMPGQASKTKLSPVQTQHMITHAVRKPFLNARSIVGDSPATVGLTEQFNVRMGTFRTMIDTELLTVNGRVLMQPKLKYKNESAMVRNGGWNMSNVKFNTAATLRNWYCMVIALPGDRSAFGKPENVQNMLDDFRANLSKTGMIVSPCGKPIRLALEDEDDAKLEEYLMNCPGPIREPRLVLVVLPFSSKKLYTRVKQVADRRAGIHTICVIASKIVKQQPQFFANVGLKMNMKLGGINQLLDDQQTRLGVINEDKTMVIGIDVTHPSPDSLQGAPSVAGMVASIDRWLGQYPADIRMQEGRKEMVTDLGSMLKTRLALWKTKGKHAALPENLLIYRDGVSEGQYSLVLEQELPLLRKACEETYPATETKKGLPHISIIIVGKRHHTRFYPTSVNDADQFSNTKSGTIVDRGITEPRNWDFYLQSHTAITGTARPAHYYVILDEIFTKRKLPFGKANAADVLEEITHSMTFLYGRATKAVSICPPAYYADLVCERARVYLSQIFDGPSAACVSSRQVDVGVDDVVVHPNLRDTMFYV